MSSGQPSRGSRPTPSQYDDLYDFEPASAPAPPPNRLLEAMLDRGRPVAEPAQSKRADAPPHPALSFFVGVFGVPFYPMIVMGFIGTSIGLIISGSALVFLLIEGAKVGMVAARPLGMCVFFFGILSLGYTFACCRTIIENTSEGLNSIDDAPEFDWRGWALAFMFGGAVIMMAAAVGYLVQLASFIPLPIIAPVVTFFVLPVVALSVLQADSLAVPLSLPVLKSFVTVWWAWCLFYLVTGFILLMWLGVTVAALVAQPYVAVLIAAPLLAAIILIYARLLGRLAWCASLAEGD